MDVDESASRATIIRHDWVLLALLGLSLGANVVLGVGILRVSSAPVRTPAAAARDAAPAIGSTLVPLMVERLGGQTETVNYTGDDRQTILYVFTPTCKWCERNLDNLQMVADVAARRKLRLIGLSLDPNVEDYVRAHKISFPVYINPSAESVRSYGLGATPHTLVISQGGILRHSWRGAYNGKTKTEVEAWLGEKLPGLQQASRMVDPGPEGGTR